MSQNSPADQTQVRRSPELLSRNRSRLLIVDMQEKLLPVIKNNEAIVAGCAYLIEAAEALQIPVVVSEQYPAGLGSTAAAITTHVCEGQTFEKMRFSAAEGFQAHCNSSDAVATSPTNRNQVVIAGIETHICILQTTFDLLAQGLRVFVVEDVVGSRNEADHIVALRRIRDAGGVVLSAESVAFEWCEVAGNDVFRQISRLTRDRDANRVHSSDRP